MNANSPASLQLDTSRAALLIVDVQERLSAAMPEAVLAEVERNIGILCEAARQFDIPMVVSEQYPRGLGKTIESVEQALAGSARLRRLEKLDFGVGAAPEFAPIWEDFGRDQWILTGMESHVCVYQTARQLLERGAAVHVPVDAVLSRRKTSWKVGMRLIERAGGILTSTEALVFDLMARAGTPEFKVLSKLMR